VTDLFSDILAGVEHLHRHGVAHLDLKLANVCVRFRGADLDVKVIDLGLSDDPQTLAYLRQAEGPISLWNDYSAPEFRRPRSHPLVVDGRFRGDACCLDWPCPEPTATDAPTPGDLVFFEERDLASQRWRVVDVRPGSTGRLQVQAEAEPEYHPWLGNARTLAPFGPEARSRQGLIVVLEKHCGYSADVYSLGMLLLAVLVGKPAVADFREALPSVQIELEDLLREPVPLPGRALVRHLLTKPSKHLQVLHAYASKLSAYGVAQPLAEELLGVVLRATLRGDTRVFYLTDRGSDARPALRRLRADLDAVRSAAANAFTTAQAAAVREARLAALDRLRARLLNRANHTVPAAADPDPRLLFTALDLGTAGDEHRARELAYLSPLAGQPASVLDRWERELSGFPGDGMAAGRTWDFLLRYCRIVNVDTPTAETFLECYHGLIDSVLRVGLSTDEARAEDRERVRSWVDEHECLAERLKCGPQFVDSLRQFLSSLRDKLLVPWDRGLRGRRFFLFRRHATRVPLNPRELLAIRSEEIGSDLHRLEAAVRKGSASRQRRAADWESALTRWRAWHAGRAWLGALGQLETEALQQREALEARFAEWDQQWLGVLDGLQNFLAQVNDLLHAYEPLRSPQPTVDELSIRLTRSQRERLDLRIAEESLTWLQQNWPAPNEKMEAVFALWELGTADS
jgi:serine/threonine protein kinase